MDRFSQVEELALLVKDNLYSKHLILSMEGAFVEFLQSGTGSDEILELEPMVSYHRMLLHRLADIFGLTHESIGQGEDRHMVLKRSSESSIPSMLVCDILWQYGEAPAPTTPQLLLKRGLTLEEYKLRQPPSGQSTISLEEREATYMSARNRIFSSEKENNCQMGAATQKPRNVPVVAKRMIVHALGHQISKPQNEESVAVCKNESKKLNDKLSFKKKLGQTARGFDKTFVAKYVHQAAAQIEHDASNLNEVENFDEPNTGSSSENHLHNGRRGSTEIVKDVRSEHVGAAKRIFAQALGLPAVK